MNHPRRRGDMGAVRAPTRLTRSARPGPHSFAKKQAGEIVVEVEFSVCLGPSTEGFTDSATTGPAAGSANRQHP